LLPQLPAALRVVKAGECRVLCRCRCLLMGRWRAAPERSSAVLAAGCPGYCHCHCLHLACRVKAQGLASRRPVVSAG